MFLYMVLFHDDQTHLRNRPGPVLGSSEICRQGQSDTVDEGEENGHRNGINSGFIGVNNGVIIAHIIPSDIL